MRITNKMTITSTVSNIQTNLKKLDKTNNMLSSGRKISIPEDDPTGAVKAMGYRSNLQEIEQYITNVGSAKTTLNSTDVAFGQVTNILQKVRELGVEAANDTFEQSARDAIADEVTQLLDEVVGLANTKVGNRYIFGGFETTEAPFKSYNGNQGIGTGNLGPDLTDVDGNLRKDINADNTAAVEYIGDSGRLTVEIDESVITSYNISGQEVFVNGGNIFRAIMDLRDNIYKGDVVLDKDGDNKTMQISIEEIENSINKILRYRSEVGAKMLRMDNADNKLQSQKINITDLLSKTEDTDVAQTVMDLKIQESVQRMSLSVGARVIQPTLMDFLR